MKKLLIFFIGILFINIDTFAQDSVEKLSVDSPSIGIKKFLNNHYRNKKYYYFKKDKLLIIDFDGTCRIMIDYNIDCDTVDINKRRTTYIFSNKKAAVQMKNFIVNRYNNMIRKGITNYCITDIIIVDPEKNYKGYKVISTVEKYK